MMTRRRTGFKIAVTLVTNFSLNVRETVIEIQGSKWLPNFQEFINDVKIACDELPYRIYWRVSNSEFMNVSNYLDFKTALNLMVLPRIYVVLEEPEIFSKDHQTTGENYDSSDVEILRCITTEVDNSREFNYPFAKGKTAFGSEAAAIYTCEYRDVYRKLKILLKVIRREEMVDKLTPCHQRIQSDCWNRNEITITWRELKRALSLLCVRSSSSGNTAMLEAPPGSREDLVEAARIPCTQPTDLDAMLYGYTNSIYVLDHAQESLPDMDMLQLFASPAGRALVVNEPQPKGTSLTSSMHRDSSLRSKNGRLTSGTGTVSAPASPPRHRKSSAELYKEAAEILGLTCSMTDSCRCIDCQSNYFDCEEDYGDTRTEVAAGTPILHAFSHPLTCTIQ